MLRSKDHDGFRGGFVMLTHQSLHALINDSIYVAVNVES